MSTTSPPPQLDKQTKLMCEPIEYSKRYKTDCLCLIVGLLFSITLVTLAVLFFNYDTYTKSSLPSDSSGKVCGVDYPGYGAVYFTKLPDISKRVCVQSCPKPGDAVLKCRPSGDIGCRFNSIPGYQVNYYDSTLRDSTNGGICEPNDQTMAATLDQKAGLANRNTFYKSINVLGYSLLLCLGVSILYTIFVQCIPNVMVRVAIFGGLLLCALLAVMVYLYPSSNTAVKIGIGIALSIVALIVLITITCNRSTLQLSVALMRQSARFTKETPNVYCYIPLFMIFIAGFLVLVLFEYRSFLSSGTPEFSPQKGLYYTITGTQPKVLSILLLMQLVWGLSFLKQALNFCVAGRATGWYFRNQFGFCEMLKILIAKHLGSVIACSFMTAFFTIPDMIVDLLKPDNTHQITESENQSYSCCGQILDLVRSDSMGYVAFTGNPFCNSAKYCEYLCHQSNATNQNQSANRTYRLCAHILIAGSVTLAALYIQGQIDAYAILAIFILSIFICTCFISIHADAAEAIQIMFLMQEEYSKRDNTHKKFYKYDDPTFEAQVRNEFINAAVNKTDHKDLALEIVQAVKASQAK